MARQLRIEYAGAMSHVTVRSNGKQALFGDDEDRRYLLSRIAKACDEHKARIYLLCLMENHLGRTQTGHFPEKASPIFDYLCVPNRK